MEKVQGTVNELMARMGVKDRQVFYGLLRGLESLGKARVVAQKPPEGGKGKPSAIWEVAETVTISFKGN
jgi:hypothetical protein